MLSFGMKIKGSALMETICETPNPDDSAAFVNATYGILADDPIERPEELPVDERDNIE